MKGSLRYLIPVLAIGVFLAWQQGAFQRMRNPASLNGDTCVGKKFCVIVYLAPWCPHCKASLSQAQTLLGKSLVGDTGVRVVVGLGRGSDSSAMAARIARNITLDDDESIAHKLGVRGVPAYVVLDSEGTKLIEGAEGFSWVAEKFKL
jgi:protein-disulfide isomerase